MDKNEIIARLAQSGVVRTMLENAGRHEQVHNLQDLEQDIFLQLLQKPDEFIQSLHEKNELQFYIAGLLRKAIFSKNSRYYYIYKKPSKYSELPNE